MMAEKHRMIIPGIQRLVPDVCDFVESIALRANLNDRAVYHCQMAVDEACTNIIEHGFRNSDTPGHIEITCQDEPDRYRITIIDDSPPFNPLLQENPDPTTPLTDREPGGWGIFFIKKMMDEVSYTLENGRNKLTMVKLKTPENVREPIPALPDEQNGMIREYPGGIWGIAPSGRLDSNTAPALQSLLDDQLASGHINLLIDMSEVSYISTSGLKALVNAWRSAQGKGGRVVLAGMRAQIYEVFETVGFDQIFDIFATPEEALHHLRNQTA